MSSDINKILVANRGEIAVRVIRSCREMNIQSVAVFSDADREAPHVLMSDEAYLLGPPPARESYLLADKIIETALKCKAQAIHPGYGFLAENGDFAEAVADAGLIFIGPPPDAIRTMGSKTEARRIMMDAKVPVVPGATLKEGGTVEDAQTAAEKIGFPVLIKAAMGGGGKGMRVVRDASEFQAALEGAQREALSAFGDGEVYLERFIEGPRHVEIQVLADAHGDCIHLYERECSIQRRHQKVIEEAPAPALDVKPELRDLMGETAVAAAKACGYVNAGTVEFLFDPESQEYYFLEMNTRLQVEHPVTEAVTGIDLVKEQIKVARGEKLTIPQKNVRHRGHSIEVRVYAEDPDNNFLPDAGKIRSLTRPDGPWVRVDSGVTAGSEVGVYYDPLVAKLVVWGPDRADAIKRMHRALGEYRVSGFATNIAFNRWIMDHPRFQSGDFDTRFIEQEWSGQETSVYDEDDLQAAAIAAAIWAQERSETAVNIDQPEDDSYSKPVSNWKMTGRRDLMR